MSDNKDRVVAITGAGGGVGRETALRFAEEAGRLVLMDVTQASVDAAASLVSEQFPEVQILAIAVDVADVESVQAAADAVRDWSGRVDVLALVAGVIQEAAPVDELSVEHWDFVQSVNLRGPFVVSRAFIPLMPSHAGASIVTISSWWGRAGHAFFAAYCTSKAGVISLTQVLAAELAERGIRANSVAPGNIDTGMHRAALEVEAQERGISFAEMKETEWAKIPLGIAGPPRTIADAVAFLASPNASYITGASLDVNGGVMFN